MSRLFLRALTLTVPAVLLLVAAAGPASAVQRTVTIYQIQDTTSVGRVVVGSTDSVTTTGVITGADTRPTGFGFYIQDVAGGNYSGVLVFTGGANTYADSGYARGDLITVTGRTTEFQNETEIISLTGSAFGASPPMAKIGTAPVPAAIALPNFGAFSETAAYPFAERYEGVYVSLTNGKNVRYPIYNSGILGTFPSSTWLVTDNTIPGSTDTVRVDGFTMANPAVSAPSLGVVAPSFRGIGHQRTRGYGIQLRDGADIVVPSPPTLLNAYATSNSTIRLVFDRALDPTTAQNPANYSRQTLGSIDAATIVGAGNQTVDLTTTTDAQVPADDEAVTAAGVKSTLGVAMAAPATQFFRAGVTSIRDVQTDVNADSSQFAFEQVTVRGVVHARDEQLYYIQEGTATGPSSGIAIFAPIASLAVGDDITVSGVVTEFGSLSQLTEFSGLDYQFEHAAGVAKFTPVTVAPGLIGTLTGVEPESGEAYEAMFVELANVTVVQDSLPNGQFLVQGGGGAGDTVRVDDTMFRQDYLYGRGDNYLTVVPYIRGLVNDAFGQYTVNPRDSADISDQLVDVTPGVGGLDFAIRGITPTPVSFARGGSAIVNFTVPTAGRASLRVYDVAGRLVATPLANAEVAAGPQAIALDARNLGGGRLGSGIFFVQLQLGNRLATAKLVVTD